MLGFSKLHHSSNPTTFAAKLYALISFPPAKLNLGLHILGKRPDGFHSIESLFYPTGWTDVLEIVEDPLVAGAQFSSSGIPIPGDPATNLCVKAYQLLAAEKDLPGVRIHLLKNVPIGAGLGGGSADGAYALLMLNELFELQYSLQELERLAENLGSDCPFFIQAKPTFVSGRGEVLTAHPLDLSRYYLRIVHPGIHIGTAEAYAGVRPGPADVPLMEILEGPINQWKDLLKNDFEESVFPNHAVLGSIKKDLYEQGAIYASMSGSGSSVFGIFEDAPKPVQFSNQYRSWEGPMTILAP